MYKDMEEKVKLFREEESKMNAAIHKHIQHMKKHAESILQLGIAHMKSLGYVVTDVRSLTHNNVRFIVHRNTVKLLKIEEYDWTLSITFILKNGNEERTTLTEDDQDFDKLFPGYARFGHEDMAWKEAINIQLPVAVPEVPTIIQE